MREEATQRSTEPRWRPSPRSWRVPEPPGRPVTAQSERGGRPWKIFWGRGGCGWTLLPAPLSGPNSRPSCCPWGEESGPTGFLRHFPLGERGCWAPGRCGGRRRRGRGLRGDVPLPPRPRRTSAAPPPPVPQPRGTARVAPRVQSAHRRPPRSDWLHEAAGAATATATGTGTRHGPKGPAPEPVLIRAATKAGGPRSPPPSRAPWGLGPGTPALSRPPHHCRARAGQVLGTVP